MPKITKKPKKNKKKTASKKTKKNRPSKKEIKKASFTHWCITLNNPKDREFDRLYTCLSQSGEGGPCSYAVMGMEHGEKDFTEHCQIYIELYAKGLSFRFLNTTLG